MPGKVLLHSESDIKAGVLKVDDAYDLRLYQLPTGDLEVEVFMKLQFFFKNTKTQIWKDAEKSLFVKNWIKDINKAWGGKVIKTLSSGKKVYLNFQFDTQIGGWMFDHWEITVSKIKPGTFQRSYVSVHKGSVVMDSEDLTPVNKGAVNPQRGAVHEFGHMLGLDDEYRKASPHKADTPSVMHSSEVIRPRHNATILKWLTKALTIKKIK